MEKLQLGAIDIQTKKYTSPSEATKGKEYKCVDCDKRVILRKGEVRRPHFAHYLQTNVCSYYEHPNEAQIHKDAKLLMQKMLNEKKMFYFKRECLDCKNDYAFEDSPSFDYKDDDKAILEYRDPGNKWIADIALINNKEIRCIIEIKNTHKTVTPRPEPWFEIDATNFINTINRLTEEILKDPEEYSYRNKSDYVFEIPCLRIDQYPRCYGSFCYYEKWVRRIPGYNTTNSDNSCILCKKEDYTPQWGDSKFQNGQIRVCFDCIRKEFYQKKLRDLYSDDKKNILKNNIIQPIQKIISLNNLDECRGACFEQMKDLNYYKKNKCNYNCKLMQCNRCSKNLPKWVLDSYDGKCGECNITSNNNFTKKELSILNRIPILFERVGSDAAWRQAIPCVECKRNQYSPVYLNKIYYTICKICLANDQVQENILKKINDGKISNKPECMITDD